MSVRRTFGISQVNVRNIEKTLSIWHLLRIFIDFFFNNKHIFSVRASAGNFKASIVLIRQFHSLSIIMRSIQLAKTLVQHPLTINRFRCLTFLASHLLIFIIQIELTHGYQHSKYNSLFFFWLRILALWLSWALVQKTYLNAIRKTKFKKR